VAFDETRREALRRWYGRDECIRRIEELRDAEKWFDLEQYVRQDGLMPLVFRDELPDWLVTEEGKPLFTAADLHPGNNRESWAEAVEIGWEVIEERTGVERSFVDGYIDEAADADWERFMKSVEERKKRRGTS
jgi:hypothetical protein